MLPVTYTLYITLSCYNIKIDEEQFKNTDFMVHEENIEGKPVVILAQMDMEYDGRGRIVFFSYVREEDYALVNDEFKSVAYQYWNERPSASMMQIEPSANIPMGMMLGRTAMAQSSARQVEPWFLGDGGSGS